MAMHTTVSIVFNVLNTLLVLVLARHLPRYWRQLPWMVALTAYFALREASQVRFWFQPHPAPPVGSGSAARAAQHVPSWIDLSFDLLSMAVLVVLVVTTSRMFAGLQATRDAAAYREEEYGRALRHYNQLVRHRVFNPLTVIRGAALTLQADIADRATRAQLLDVIVQSTDVIRDTTLEPERRSDEEHSLDAVPHLEPTPAARNPRKELEPGRATDERAAAFATT